MLHKEFFGLIFLGFVFWIIIAVSPTQRIENACRPVGWSGNVITSMSALVLPNHQETVQSWFDKIEYGCRYTTWRLFYQEDYNKWKASTAGAVTSAEAAKKQEAGAVSSPPSVEQDKESSPTQNGPSAPKE